MKKIYLFCESGMSTSLLASRMQKVADANKLDLKIKAFPDSKIDTIVNSEHPEFILLGPQVRHIYNEVYDKYKDKAKVIMVVDKDDYGTMNGERVLKKALLSYKKGMAK